MATRTISWTTTVEEYYTAEIDADEWEKMENDGDTVNDLGTYELAPISSATVSRDVEFVSDLPDECECSESYRHRGEHTPGCPADDGERIKEEQ